MRQAGSWIPYLVRRIETQYVVALVAGILLVTWTGFELVFMYNVPALGYFIVGVLSILSSLFLMRPALDTSA